METRICRKCDTELEIGKFEVSSTGYRRWVCGRCRRRQKTGKKNLAAISRWRQKNLCSVLYSGCKQQDKRHGFVGFDLDQEFIRTLISSGCRYCGETELKMTLDRIDNNAGHTKANVLPCCLRCNYIRGSMPFDAWMAIVPAIRKAREAGLFGLWRTTPFNRKHF